MLAVAVRRRHRSGPGEQRLRLKPASRRPGGRASSTKPCNYSPSHRFVCRTRRSAAVPGRSRPSECPASQPLRPDSPLSRRSVRPSATDRTHRHAAVIREHSSCISASEGRDVTVPAGISGEQLPSLRRSVQRDGETARASRSQRWTDPIVTARWRAVQRRLQFRFRAARTGAHRGTRSMRHSCEGGGVSEVGDETARRSSARGWPTASTRWPGTSVPPRPPGSSPVDTLAGSGRS